MRSLSQLDSKRLIHSGQMHFCGRKQQQNLKAWSGLTTADWCVVVVHYSMLSMKSRRTTYQLQQICPRATDNLFSVLLYGTLSPSVTCKNSTSTSCQEDEGAGSWWFAC